jgi:hypothetical protein
MVDGGVTVVRVGQEEFRATESTPFVFGRDDQADVVGLDPNDMGISSLAGSVRFDVGLWWVINLSSKRHFLVEQQPDASPQRLGPGERTVLTKSHSVVLVPGVVFTHRLDIRLPDEAVTSLQVSLSPTSGTITFGDVVLSDRDRAVLATLFRGYLLAFPLHDPRPLTYQETAERLGAPWTRVTVRKQVERLKQRIAKSGLHLEGPRANDELADHLIANGLLGVADLHPKDRQDG